jgi:CheY-like chemotaxis protein
MSILKARRILLIDGENPIRELIQLCLETVAGWEVLTVDSGSEGIVKAEAEQVDAILLDLDSAMMCDMHWLQILQNLQNNPATHHIPVILLTAKVQSETLTRFIKLEVRAVLGKPFDLMTLASQLAAVLGWNV